VDRVVLIECARDAEVYFSSMADRIEEAASDVLESLPEGAYDQALEAMKDALNGKLCDLHDERLAEALTERTGREIRVVEKRLIARLVTKEPERYTTKEDLGMSAKDWLEHDAEAWFFGPHHVEEVVSDVRRTLETF